MTRFIVAAVAALSSVGAFALDDIVVTAERREASIQDVPLAVTALSSEQLQNFQVREAQDLQRYVPSLNMFGNITSPTNLSLSLRGGLQQDASLVVAESPVGIYVDDVYVGRLNGNNVTLSDIERVEVLRGPQGTLYGRNTGYGAIKFISRIPDEDFWFDATAGAGNYDQALLNASVGGPLSDIFAGSLAGQFQTKDGQYRNVAEDQDVGLIESVAARGKLHYTGSDVFDALLSVSYSNTETDSLQLVNGITPNVPDNAQFTTKDLVFPNGEFNTRTPWGPRNPNPITDRPSGETEQTIVGLTLTYDINEQMTAKFISGYVGLNDRFSTDFNGNGTGFIGAADIESDQYTQELQLLGTAMDDRLNYLFGVFYLQEDAAQLFGWNIVAPLSQSLIQTEIESIAAFGEASFQFTDQLSATLGLRWTEDKKDFQFDFERFDGNLFGIPGGTDQVIFNDQKFDEWTPRIGLDYNLGEVGPASNMLLYAQAARGFKSGGFSAIALASTFPVGVYGPETNWTYEFGMKADWLDNRLRTNLAYFFSDIEDIQQNSTSDGGPPGAFEFPVQNSGDAEIQGLEFEIVATPLDGLNLFLSGSLLDGKYTRLNPFSSAGQAEAEFGVSPQTPQTADYQVTVGFDYSFEMPGDLLGMTSFGADVYVMDNYVTAATNDFFNSGWEQWNAYISVDVAENWSLRLAGKNLADDFIITSGSRGLGGFVSLPPREILFSVTYRTAP